MDKNKKKKPTYNQDIIKGLKLKYGFSESYIRKSINGDRTGLYPIKIKDEYNALFKSTNKIINEQINQL
jgi:hypothetical protein